MNENKFKKGDRVRCVNATDCPELTRNSVYGLNDVTAEGRNVIIGELTYGSYRFELANQLPKDGFKIRIKNEEHSRLVQGWLFTQGYTWLGVKHIKYTDRPYITVSKEKSLSWSCTPRYFEDHPSPEIILDITYTATVSYLEPPQEILELNGRTYAKNQVEELVRICGTLIDPVEGEG